MRALATITNTLLAAFKTNEEGRTAIEYGLISGAIAMAVIAALLVLGNDIHALLAAA